MIVTWQITISKLRYGIMTVIISTTFTGTLEEAARQADELCACADDEKLQGVTVQWSQLIIPLGCKL